MINAGVIGLGKMGLSHAAILGAHEHVNLIAVSDTSSLVLKAFNRFSKVNTYSNYKKMLKEEHLDCIVIATPTKFHYQMAKDAMDKNIHVFCEKPFSLTSSEGMDLVSIASQKSIINQVGYHNHFIGTFRELKRLLNEGILGELVHFTGQAYGPVVTKEKGSTWRTKSSEGGGCLYDYASHVINLVQEIIARPNYINGALLKSYYSKKVEDAVYSLITLENNLSGVLLVNWSDETYRKMSTSLTIEGKKGKIICDATELKIYLKVPSGSENLEKGWTTKYITDFALPTNYYLRGEEYSAQIDYFIGNVISSKKGVYNTFEQGMYTDRVIEMIVDKAKTIK